MKLREKRFSSIRFDVHFSAKQRITCSLCPLCITQIRQNEWTPTTEHLSFSGDFAKNWTDAEDIMTTDFFNKQICQETENWYALIYGMYVLSYISK